MAGAQNGRPLSSYCLGFPGQRVLFLPDGNRQIADGDADYVIEIADLVEKAGFLNDGFAALPPGPVAAADFLGGAVGEGHAEVSVAGMAFGIGFESGGLGRPIHGIDRVGDARAERGDGELVYGCGIAVRGEALSRGEVDGEVLVVNLE